MSREAKKKRSNVTTVGSRLTIVSREAKKKRSNVTTVGIKTHDSESRGQEEAQQRDHYRELFTCSTALKLANALAKPPLKLSLSYY